MAEKKDARRPEQLEKLGVDETLEQLATDAGEHSRASTKLPLEFAVPQARPIRNNDWP